ncbi:MAG: hypothetical protein LBD23_07955 [Oscillospiraceae bacterium]|jgi:hypothetical protein|nr:hypothetical protein [Oscillospiraceae bacterium]
MPTGFKGAPAKRYVVLGKDFDFVSILQNATFNMISFGIGCGISKAKNIGKFAGKLVLGSHISLAFSDLPNFLVSQIRSSTHFSLPDESNK